MILGEVRKYFSVELYVGFVEFIDELAVACSILPGGGVYLDLPESSEIPLFLFSVGKLE